MLNSSMFDISEGADNSISAITGNKKLGFNIQSTGTDTHYLFPNDTG